MIFKKIVVGISGGVDSAVAALILKNKGYNVQGAFMKNWDIIDEKTQCFSDRDYEDAQIICNKLKIPIVQVNFVKEYWNEVFGYFLKDYESGLTPNPDILCNKHIKFDQFYKFALEQCEADAIATGHYAQSSFGSFLEHYRPNQNVKLLQAVDTFKDQTFFLSQVPQTALRKTMFPLGLLTKNQVKMIAKDAGLKFLAKKKESTGICFIGQRRFQDFISEYLETKSGMFVDIDTGLEVGKHEGIHNWTVGQRCRIGGCIKPYFVARKEPETNVIFVAQGTNHPSLFSDVFKTDPPYWIDRIPTNDTIFNCKFRFQHTKPFTNCTIHWGTRNGNLIVRLEKPLRAITPGQYAVFYTNTECLGCARIKSPIYNQDIKNNVKFEINS